MYEWNEAVQKMIDWIEVNISDNPTLPDMSRQIGYSPYYCSVQFHRLCGMTIKSYIARRRLALAVLDIQNTSDRILDIALKYGFSSQEALTRAFRAAFGCTPASYRRNLQPIPIQIYKVIYFPQHYRELYKGGTLAMNNATQNKVSIRTEYIPTHKYLGIWATDADNYGSFWQTRDCDRICGIIDSLGGAADPVVTGHTAGWYYQEGVRKYFYGTGLPADYDGKVPEGFELREFPGSYYLVFRYPPFDYLRDNDQVMAKVEEMAWNYDITAFANGQYTWNENLCQCYQRHYPEEVGYEILRPIRKK